MRRRSAAVAPGLVAMAAALVAAAGAPAGLGAQEDGADTLRLTLSRALDMAVGANPTYRQAARALELNPAEMRQIWADEILPRASLTLFNTAFTGNRQRVAVDNFGNPIQNPQAEWTYFSSTSQQLSLVWAFQGRSLLHAYRRQRIQNEGREVDAERALTDLQLGVRRAYMDALEQRDLLQAEEELVEARRIDLEVAERLFSLAHRTRVDVLNAELALEQQQMQLGQQRAAYARALLTLRTQLGMEGPAPLALEPEPLPIFDPSELDAEALVEQALRNHPEVRRSEVNVRASSLELSSATDSWWPRVAAGVDVYRRSQQLDAGSLFEVGIDEPLDSRFFIQFSLPMFNSYFQNRLQQERARIQLENDRDAERETRLRIEERVRAALLDLRSQWGALGIAERSAGIAAEALELAREQYRLGTRTFEDLRAAFEQEASTRRQVIQARHSFVDALLTLEEAVGAPVRPAALR